MKRKTKSLDTMVRITRVIRAKIERLKTQPKDNNEKVIDRALDLLIQYEEGYRSLKKTVGLIERAVD